MEMSVSVGVIENKLFRYGQQLTNKEALNFWVCFRWCSKERNVSIDIIGCQVEASNLYNCYKSVQRFRVTCLFTGQYDTAEYGTIASVI